MGLKKMLNNLSDLLDPAVEKRKKTRKNIKTILKKLKAKKTNLKKNWRRRMMNANATGYRKNWTSYTVSA